LRRRLLAAADIRHHAGSPHLPQPWPRVRAIAAKTV